LRNATELIHAHDLKDGHVNPPYRISFFPNNINCPHCLRVKDTSETNIELGCEMSNQGEQSIKLGNDPSVIRLLASQDNPEVFISQDQSSWTAKDQEVNVHQLRQKIEPWLTALFQSEHLNLLVGAGLSTSIQASACGALPPGMGWITDLKLMQAEIDKAAYAAALKSGRNKGNIEDQIRAINDVIRGLEVLTILGGEQPDNPPPPYVAYRNLPEDLARMKSELRRCLKSFSESICSGEEAIKKSDKDRKTDTFNYLVSFLMSFASRTATRDRLHIFTTNYDRIIEMGAELAGLRLIDRFIGSISPVFRSSRLEVDYHYNPPGIRGEPRYLEGVARFTKLHGSLDWFESDRSIRRLGVPFGSSTLSPFFDAIGEEGNYERLMIYPNSVKDRETAEYPYVELFRDLAAAACRPNSTLVTYGYSFGDEHINRVIEDMLTVPSTHVVIIAFGDPLNRIENFIKETGRGAQITLLLGNHLGDLKALVDNYLPKPAIDRTTIRMADMLKQRGVIEHEYTGSSNFGERS